MATVPVVAVPKEVKARVEAKIKEGLALAQKAYGCKLTFPSISYQLKGRVAGYAHPTKWLIQLNSVLLMENLEEFMGDTVPHELAHLIDFHLNPQNFTSEIVRKNGRWVRTKRDIHGASWSRIMRTLGAEPTRCHSYDTTNSRVRKKVQYEYRCNDCGSQMLLGPNQHAKQLRGANFRLRKCIAVGHGRCSFVAKVGDSAPAPVIKKAASGPAPKAPTGGSKIDKCRALYNPEKSRAENIALFVSDAGCTIAGAGTYYVKISKE